MNNVVFKEERKREGGTEKINEWFAMYIKVQREHLYIEL